MSDSKSSANHLVEQKKRLSDSIIWDLQRRAYQKFGIGAWSHQGVPFYLTSNPLIADQYICVIIGFLRDCLTPNSPFPIDPSEPINIVDLGAGSGRFDYLFLKKLLANLQHLPLKGIKVRLIMTDIAHENIKFWQHHPYFQRFIKEGMLDFAHYQHDLKPGPLHLIHSKQHISKESHKNPMILIANYFFDTIPQDLFRIRNGLLEEGRISLLIDDKEKIENPEVIGSLETSYDFLPIPNQHNYYEGHPEWNQILKIYTEKFDNVTFTFPKGALESLDFFEKLSNKKFLLLCGDQGVCTDEQIKNWGEPKLDKHATFSMMVSYHALALYFRLKRGEGFLTRDPDPLFVVMAAVMGAGIHHLPNTHCGFDHSLNQFEPKDYWKLIGEVEKGWKTPSLTFLLNLVKLGSWDPNLIYTFYSQIYQQLSKATPQEKSQLSFVIHKIWDQFFPIHPEESDFILNLGVLFYEMKQYSDALLFFKRAIDINPKNAQAYNNMGASFLALEDSQSAMDCFDQSRKLLA